jgi:hypothetical protein
MSKWAHSRWIAFNLYKTLLSPLNLGEYDSCLWPLVRCTRVALNIITGNWEKLENTKEVN